MGSTSDCGEAQPWLGTVVLPSATGVGVEARCSPTAGQCRRSSCGGSISALETLVLKWLTAELIIQAPQVGAERISFSDLEDYF